MHYESSDRISSKVKPGVVFTISRMSFGRRLELMRLVREIAPRLEFYSAGTAQQDQIEARILSAEIDELYLRWGLDGVEGIQIDGEPATPSLLANAGPEDLCLEAVNLVKAACRLSEASTKN